MNNRTIMLVVLLGALGVAYIWFVLWPSGPDLRMVIVQRPAQPVTFAFDRETIVEEVRIVTQEPVSAQNPGGDTYQRMIWHMVPRPDGDGEGDDPRPRKHVTYGRGIRGLKPAEGFKVRGEPLESGTRYTFIADTADGTVQAVFEAK